MIDFKAVYVRLSISDLWLDNKEEIKTQNLKGETMKVSEIVSYLDELLNIRSIEDISLNGLQVGSDHEVKRVAVSVDASLEVFKEAKDADMLIVHHGLYWGKPIPIVDAMFERIKFLIENNVALYAAHLPLDLHPEYGNNVEGIRLLGVEPSGEFGNYHGINIGYEFEFERPVKLDELKENFDKALGTDSILWDFGPKEIKRGSYVSGDAISLLPEAIEKKLDIYITGEPRHSYYWNAFEAGINVLFGGHYKTETLGVRALGKHLEEKFGLEVYFINKPTGF